MAAQEQKPRKRIVPQLIVASPTKLPDAYDGLPPPSPQLQVTDLREQAAFAKEHLGLDRKIYVDLRPYQESNKAVNWKQVGGGRERDGSAAPAAARPPPPAPSVRPLRAAAAAQGPRRQAGGQGASGRARRGPRRWDGPPGGSGALVVVTSRAQALF